MSNKKKVDCSSEYDDNDFEESILSIDEIDTDDVLVYDKPIKKVYKGGKIKEDSFENHINIDISKPMRKLPHLTKKDTDYFKKHYITQYRQGMVKKKSIDEDKLKKKFLRKVKKNYPDKKFTEKRLNDEFTKYKAKYNY